MLAHPMKNELLIHKLDSEWFPTNMLALCFLNLSFDYYGSSEVISNIYVIFS